MRLAIVLIGLLLTGCAATGGRSDTFSGVYAGAYGSGGAGTGETTAPGRP